MSLIKILLCSVTFCIISIYFVSGSSELYCRSERDQKLDWFINYKLPRLQDDSNVDFLSEGKAYAYITPSSDGDWTISKISIERNTSMLGRTVQHVINVKKNITYLFYNDEPPNESGTSAGHLKGIVAFDKTSGIWIVHSIPKFSETDRYQYPDNALHFGQSVLCISFPIAALNQISKQLLFSAPKIYESQLTEEVSAYLDEKAKSIFTDKPEFVHKAPFQHTAILKSLNREIFMSFSKDNQFNQDLYSAMVAPSLHTPLDTETWRRGVGTNLPPTCGVDYPVLDVSSIKMTATNQEIDFKSLDDHSKWAISSNSSRPWICIGDINRMKSQFKRGGGTVCLQSKTVWKAYSSIISETDLCPTK